jgi:D-allulose-6-phosphate 3-epimerase
MKAFLLMNKMTDNKPLFSPSLMCLDFLEIRKQIEILNQHCDMLHADIMDGHFARNITLSVDLIKAILRVAEIPVEAHLMVTSPNDYIEALAAAGVSTISLQAETIQRESYRIIRRIKDLGCKVGIVLCPATPLSMADWYLDQVDILTIMTVEVGFAGQKFIPRMIEKIAEAKQLRDEKDYHYIIQVDGAIGKANYKALYEAGTRAFVLGTSGLFKPNIELSKGCELMKEEFTEATGVAL